MGLYLRKRGRYGSSALICGATLLASFVSFDLTLVHSAQSPQLIPRSHEEREQAFREAHRAFMNVKVTDATGNPIAGLTAGDFTLLDNDHPHAINSLRFIENGTSAAMPRVVLLLDVLNQSKREFTEDVAGVRKFLARGNGRLNVPTAIALLSPAGLAVADASQDRDAVIHQLEQMTRDVKAAKCEDLTAAPILYKDIWTDRSSIQTNSDQAPNCLNQKFITSVTNLEQLAVKEESTMGRLVLIWIGPGWPLLNGKQFTPDTPQTKENFFEHFVLLLTAMREGQVTIDTVSDLHMRNASNADSIVSGVQRADEMTSESLSLFALSRQSGGQNVDDSGGATDAIARCVKDAENFYVLSFDFPASPASHQFHSVQVQVNRPGATVRTNTVYYSEP